MTIITWLQLKLVVSKLFSDNLSRNFTTEKYIFAVMWSIVYMEGFTQKTHTKCPDILSTSRDRPRGHMT